MTETYRVEAHCQEDRGINAANISNRAILGKVKKFIISGNKKYKFILWVYIIATRWQ